MWTELIPSTEITDRITEKTVDFAERFGKYLAASDKNPKDEKRLLNNNLTTSQLRKFFGEVKRQQMQGYDPTRFILLKPKLAYAVGRAKKDSKEKKDRFVTHYKIADFYNVMSKAIDLVKDEKSFSNFISVFEAIVAYHKAAEAGQIIN